jgi:BirA family transcriptional regulator, biotin operon repressor / biotin---[acetyl-CoA-carboxylase] ligase
MRIIYLDETPSTNNYATRLLQTETAEEGTVILTFRQTQGRGQAQNSWESDDFKNLTFSLVLRPTFLAASSQFLLSQAVSLGIHDFLSAETSNVSIKWPNDLMIFDGKVAGLLIENSIMGNSIAWTVAGSGINMNQETFRDYSPKAVSISSFTGKTYELRKSLDAILHQIMTRYEDLKLGKFARTNRDYLGRLYAFEKWMEYSAGEETFEARITGTDEFGRLLLEKRNGTVSAWPFKSIRMVRFT